MNIKKKYKFPWFKPYVNKNIKKKINNIIDKNQMTMGQRTYELEKKLQNHLNVKHVILTTSGTSALLISFKYQSW